MKIFFDFICMVENYQLILHRVRRLHGDKGTKNINKKRYGYRTRNHIGGEFDGKSHAGHCM